jgi:protein TonB
MRGTLKRPLASSACLSAASLSLRPEGEGADVRLIFQNQPTSRARVLSGTVVHVAAIALLVLLARIIPDTVYQAVLPTRLTDKLVWLAQPGGGGGGGGGNKSDEPPPPAELKGQQQITVPVAPEPTPQEPENIVEPPVELPPIADVPLAGATEVRPGDIAAGAESNSNARGPGDGPGSGPDRGGTGGGPGGIGDGPLLPGNGVLPPRLRRKVDPQYSAAAMQAKIQGFVLLAAVVQADGSVTDVRVIRSLDRVFGLDTKAIEAARQWQFFPGTRQGQPVPVLVNIELEFNLR